MTTDLVPLLPAALPMPAPPPGPSVDLMGLVLTGLAPQSQLAYRQDYDSFAKFLGADSAESALAALFRLPGPKANALGLAYRSSMDERRNSSATIRRRLASLRRAVNRARMVGLADYDLQVDAPAVEKFRDTAGPGKLGFERLLGYATTRAEGGNALAVRNLAIILLLHDRALRRGELVALDWPGDVDLAKPAVQILGKGRTAREWLTVNERIRESLSRWVGVRGDWPGPLFVRSDRMARERTRLTGESVNRMVQAYAVRCGLTRICRAHGLRHGAITEALDGGWDLRDVRAFSRHVNIDTVMIYDDRRKDVGGEITRSIGRGSGKRRRAAK